MTSNWGFEYHFTNLFRKIQSYVDCLRDLCVLLALYSSSYCPTGRYASAANVVYKSMDIFRNILQLR